MGAAGIRGKSVEAVKREKQWDTVVVRIKGMRDAGMSVLA